MNEKSISKLSAKSFPLGGIRFFIMILVMLISLTGFNTQIAKAVAGPNDDFDSATTISSIPANVVQDNTEATTALDDPTFGTTVGSCTADAPPVGQGHFSLWFQYTPAANGTLSVNTWGSDYDTVLGIWTGTRGNLTLVGCDDDDSAPDANDTESTHGVKSHLNFEVTANQTYFIEVVGFHVTSFGPLDLEVTAGPSPVACYPLTLGHTGDGTNPVAAPTKSVGCDSGQYLAAASINLSGAAPTAGWQIGSWTGTTNNSSTLSTNTVTMPASAHSAGVNYTKVCNILTLSHTGQGSDPVASPTNSTGCASGQYVIGESISLSGAVPTAGWQISSWTGTSNDASTANINTLTMPATATTASVNYTKVCNILTLSHNGQGSDPVASPTNSTGCASGQYVIGESISLSGAVPSAEWQISSWTGTDNNASTASSNTVTMPATAHSASVNYTQICHNLTLGHTGQGSDPVASPTNSTGCTSGRYVLGESISLSGAVPAAGWQVGSWTGTNNNSSTANTNTVTMPAGDHASSVNYVGLTTPPAATLGTPTGNIGTNYTPNFVWNQVSSAEQYYLYISGPSGKVFDQWYLASAICSAGTCTVPNPVTLGGGNFTWWVRTWNSAGYGPWSSGMAFNTTVPTPPGAATQTSPTGNLGTNYNPNFVWNEVATSTWYELYVSGPSGKVLDQWYEASAICSSGTCTASNPITLGGGNHTWWVRTWNSAGNGLWSTGMAFNTTVPTPPGAATLTSPTGNLDTNYTPNFVWNEAASATYYELYIQGPSGKVLDKWYEASAICSSGTCTAVTPISLGGGNFTWWVRTWNSAGYGPWSSGMNFNTTIPTVPTAATLVSPTGSGGSNPPVYTWNKVTGVTWYYVWVNGSSGNVFKQWYEASAVCGLSTCSVTQPSSLANGSYVWWVQTWNSAGYGPWSSSLNFSIP